MDPASLQVLISRLTGITDEMGAVLRRAAFSPNIKERADCSAALFTGEGELLVQAAHIPVHLGSMPASVLAAIDRFGGGEACTLAPGEQVVLNDPFAGGTHLNDVTVVAPCFVDGALAGWAANRAHHADLGGMAPGSMPADATEIHQEGLRIPPVVLTDGVAAIITASSRTPQERRGDLDAQVGANAVGVARLSALVAAAGATATSAFEEVLDYGERRMRAALRVLADGTWTFDDVLDSTGPGSVGPARIRVRLTIDGDDLTFDFTGTDAQRPGNVNAVEAVTVSAALFAVRAATDPTVPANGGAGRAVSVVAPPGTIVAAVAPVAVGAGNVEVSQRVADVCLGALAQVVPGRVGAASQGTMNNVLIGGDGWVSYETVGGGQGGRPGRPGMSGVHTNMTNTADTPVEAFERAFPVRIRRYELRSGSGGAGLAPGGEGIVKEWELLEPATVSLITERRMSRPWGLFGGEPGAPGENWLLPGGDESRAERVPDKCTIRVGAGDVVRMLTPGGGGWGRAGGARPGELSVFGEPSAGAVTLVDADPTWAERFDEHRARLAAALGSLAPVIEHIGSTSVPGLAATPIVDVLVPVPDPDDDAAFAPQLAAAGYVLRMIEPGHRLFRPATRDVHVHLRRADGPEARRDVLFRDRLRRSPADRALYERTKRELAKRGWDRTQDDADAKAAVIRAITGRAESWAGRSRVDHGSPGRGARAEE